jgi:CHAD domain-containing protein
MSVTVEELCARHDVDMAHAHHVAAMSLALFDGIAKTHKVARSWRHLLEVGALLHNIAYASNPEEHHTVGRDLILAETLSDFAADEQDILACLALFHRKKVKPCGEPVFQRLRSSLRKKTLALAALLRVGDALDYSQTQTCRIVSIARDKNAVRVIVDGPHAEEEADRANRKADLWNKVFPQPLTVLTVAGAAAESAKRIRGAASIGSATAPELSVSEKKAPGIGSDDAIGEAGRKVLRFHFERLLKNSSRIHDDEDIEALHRMRIAVRRLRAAMRLFGPYLPAEQVRSVRRGLAQLARTSGPMRDFDVLLNKARCCEKEAANGKGGVLEPLREFWERERAAAREKMLQYLTGKKCRTWLQAFESLLCAEPETVRDPQSVEAMRKPRVRLLRHVAPTLIWRQYGRVRRYETTVAGASVETLHALRLQCKRLRYTLELLSEILGESAEAAIALAKKAQDYLGELHDGDVAVRRVRDFLDRCARRAKRRERGAANLAAVQDYLTACEKEIKEKIRNFPEIWTEIVGEPFRRTLAEAAATP